MRLEIDLPDWVENLNIYIFADFELAAKKITTKNWEVKVEPCSHCGDCCKNITDGHKRKGILPTTKENSCANLEQRKNGEWWCKTYIPIFCLTANSKESSCNVVWNEVD